MQFYHPFLNLNHTHTHTLMKENTNERTQHSQQVYLYFGRVDVRRRATEELRRRCRQRRDEYRINQ